MPQYSRETLEILALLRDRHNVLLSGPPGTGKSRILGEVAEAFATSTTNQAPVHVAGAQVAIPRTPPPVDASLVAALPSPDRSERQVFRTVFHQNSKHREFITGLAPVVGTGAAAGATSFKVVSGTLYRASEHANSAKGASLLIIDEINRGPAVQIFGGSIVAIESDKRLAPDGKKLATTQYFEVTSPVDGEAKEYALPHHLYILAAMNQADTSVEPLDVAFLRRWVPFALTPSEEVLRIYFGLPPQANGPLPETPASHADVLEAAVRAWVAINGKIRQGRGAEMQIGHGVLMGGASVPTSVEGAQQDAFESWKILRAHVDEVFFGDVRGIAATLNVGHTGHPLTLNETTFADEPRLELSTPQISPQNIYGLLKAISG